ncbi:3'(2'),5'-bisphosphate nucleotidase [Rufibacter immobilis]|uniref:3'(2'),5'-bisphosphate nucleotidase CysQ n=1 Tax=Rufibacter immobilis TaxID=1348778 RepID=A0A3M9MSH5_9BACT|nr:3'(2'),5'-bisphosphate nucleotidase CysQ [Rufibacter immobilis]RNI28466.1 3'(2'),5'-bisphosphate nucleotidase [Rufibacter immobilis]
MKNTTTQELLSLARTAALEAGAAILEVYHSPNFGVQLKEDDSPLTRADQAAHAIISRHLAATGLPVLSEEGTHLNYEARSVWTWYWLVDPLDGTKEFIKRNGEFTVNIALMHQNQPVAGVVFAPCLETLYWGAGETGVFKEERGESTPLIPLPQKQNLQELGKRPHLKIIASRTHLSPETKTFIEQFSQAQLVSMGSSLKFMLLAEGKADLYPRFAPTMEWDTAAAHALLNALGYGIYQTDLSAELHYNKPSLLNPSFLAF